ncbi:hypothetical protein MASR1M66_04220 [Aminivibrio sp.]
MACRLTIGKRGVRRGGGRIDLRPLSASESSEKSLSAVDKDADAYQKVLKAGSSR